MLGNGNENFLPRSNWPRRLVFTQPPHFIQNRKDTLMEITLDSLIIVAGRSGLYRMLAKRGNNMSLQRIADKNMIAVDLSRSKANYISGFRIDLTNHKNVGAIKVLHKMLDMPDLPHPGPWDRLDVGDQHFQMRRVVENYATTFLPMHFKKLLQWVEEIRISGFTVKPKELKKEEDGTKN